MHPKVYDQAAGQETRAAALVDLKNSANETAVSILVQLHDVLSDNMDTKRTAAML